MKQTWKPQTHHLDRAQFSYPAKPEIRCREVQEETDEKSTDKPKEPGPPGRSEKRGSGRDH